MDLLSSPPLLLNNELLESLAYRYFFTKLGLNLPVAHSLDCYVLTCVYLYGYNNDVLHYIKRKRKQTSAQSARNSIAYLVKVGVLKRSGRLLVTVSCEYQPIKL